MEQDFAGPNIYMAIAISMLRRERRRVSIVSRVEKVHQGFGYVIEGQGW